MRVLHYCQHVLGMGHLFRSLEISRALQGHEVLLVTGGPEVSLELPEFVRREQLPVLRMDADFSALLPAEGDKRPVETIKELRCRRLLDLLRDFRPDVFLVELYPFGRRAFAFELQPALQLAGEQGCRRVCSLRDILVEKKDQNRFERRVLQLLNPDFDLLLVHSDPQVCSLERTFASMAEVRPAVAFTGYVAPAFSPQLAGQATALRRELELREGEKLLVASAGSGSVGFELLQAALEASALLAASVAHRLCLFSGPLLEEERYQILEDLARQLPHVQMQRFSPRFNAFLAAADLSVSMGGYNTVMALAATGTFGLVLPFAQNREQRMRAELLQQRGLLRVLQPQDLAPQNLASLLQKHLESAPGFLKIDLKGAQNSARCLERLLTPSATRGVVRQTVTMPWKQTQQDEQRERFFCELSQRCAGRSLGVVFRADDVALPGRNLLQLLELFCKHEVPLWPAMVPGWLQEGHWPRLRKACGDASLFVWHQHGWRHANHEICGKKSEFGPARALLHKRSDLQKGRDKLARLLGQAFTPVFTPPWNRMDADTLALLPQLDYAALSADSKLCEQAATQLDAAMLPLYPVHLDLHTRREGTAQQAWAGMLRECEQGLEHGVLGVMLHHQRMNAASFAFLDDMLQRLPGLGLEPLDFAQSLARSSR